LVKSFFWLIFFCAINNFHGFGSVTLSDTTPRVAGLSDWKSRIGVSVVSDRETLRSG